jgi:hypothetical protein
MKEGHHHEDEHVDSLNVDVPKDSPVLIWPENQEKQIACKHKKKHEVTKLPYNNSSYTISIS